MKPDLSKIHPELVPYARMIPNLTFGKNNLWLINAMANHMPGYRKPEDVQIENIILTGKDNQQKIRVRMYRPVTSTEPTPVLLWFHGGGFVMGKPQQDDDVCIYYVSKLGIVVVSVEYRLAPKHPFPAGLEDGYAALQWVQAHAQELGLDPDRIAVGGSSAGGGLAASLAQLAHDRGEVKLIFQLLVYPMLDDRTINQVDNENPYILWNQKSNRYAWESYLSKIDDEIDVPEYAAPARRENLSGLPEAWIGAGTLDMFYNEDAVYAQRLIESQVSCEFYEVPGAFHGFDVVNSRLRVVQEFRTSQISALKKRLFG